MVHIIIQLEYAIRVHIDLFTSLCQRDFVVGTVEQASIELIFQLPYLECHGWLRHVQLFTSLGEVQQARNGMEYF
jgi:hypothetical protein